MQQVQSATSATNAKVDLTKTNKYKYCKGHKVQFFNDLTGQNA